MFYKKDFKNKQKRMNTPQLFVIISNVVDIVYNDQGAIHSTWDNVVWTLWISTTFQLIGVS
ncbi:hypothetical protein [Enterococcus sp. AZ095b]|uniref:hypothetical protein n=1 Tax=Enterococcus sp. AZ095b TaxID=2774791 RepID=UPI003F685ECB